MHSGLDRQSRVRAYPTYHRVKQWLTPCLLCPSVCKRQIYYPRRCAKWLPAGLGATGWGPEGGGQGSAPMGKAGQGQTFACALPEPSETSAAVNSGELGPPAGLVWAPRLLRGTGAALFTN